MKIETEQQKKTIKLFKSRVRRQTKNKQLWICPRRKYAKNDCERWMCIYVTDSKRIAWFLSVKRIIVFCCKNSEKYIRHERFELFIDHTQLVHQRLENNVIHEVLLNFKSTFNWSDFNKRLRNRRLCQLDLKLTSGFWNSSTKNSEKIHSDKAGMSCITLLYHFDWFHWLH